MPIVGIDPSLTGTGIAIIDGGAVTAHKIVSSGKSTDDWEQRYNRGTNLVAKVAAFVPHYSLVAIEGPSYSSVGGSSHDRSGLWWRIYDTLRVDCQCTILVVSPSQRMIYATGKGNAKKDTVLAAAIKRYQHLIDIQDNNIADAVVLAAIAADLDGEPLAKLPETHMRALEKLRPEYRKLIRA